LARVDNEGTLIFALPGTICGFVMSNKTPKFVIGQVVRHRVYPFRGVVFDVDPEFNNTDEWWQSIPEDVRPNKDQPFYHLLAENEETTYVAYVSEQNLLVDEAGGPVNHPQLSELFGPLEDGRYLVLPQYVH
jgi:heat shock protein HspQ